MTIKKPKEELDNLTNQSPKDKIKNNSSARQDFISFTEQKQTDSEDTQTKKGCGYEFICFEKGRMGRRTICGQEKYYCDKCREGKQ